MQKVPECESIKNKVFFFFFLKTSKCCLCRPLGKSIFVNKSNTKSIERFLRVVGERI